MRQTAYLVINPITVDGYALLFNCTAAVRASDSITTSSQTCHKWVGAWYFVFGLVRRVSTILTDKRNATSKIKVVLFKQ